MSCLSLPPLQLLRLASVSRALQTTDIAIDVADFKEAPAVVALAHVAKWEVRLASEPAVHVPTCRMLSASGAPACRRWDS